LVTDYSDFYDELNDIKEGIGYEAVKFDLIFEANDFSVNMADFGIPAEPGEVYIPSTGGSYQ